MDLGRNFEEPCAPWRTKDAARGASDNSLVIRRGLELHEPSRAPLDRSCLLSPACPTSVYSDSSSASASSVASNSAFCSSSSGSVFSLVTADALRSSVAPGCVAAWIFFPPRQRPLADRDHAVLLALALADRQRGAFAVHIVQLEPDEFLAPDARRVERLQHGAVAQAQRCIDVWHQQDALGLLDREDGARDALFQERQLGSVGIGHEE